MLDSRSQEGSAPAGEPEFAGDSQTSDEAAPAAPAADLDDEIPF
jgi:hypothetical protein